MLCYELSKSNTYALETLRHGNHRDGDCNDDGDTGATKGDLLVRTDVFMMV